MGDKAAAKQEMVAAGVPVVPGTERRRRSTRRALRRRDRLPSCEGRRGRGRQGHAEVRDPDELEGAFQTAAAKAQASFGEPGLYLEKVIVPARHVEIQVLADGQGGVLTLGERECSIQRRHQKLIEESPSPALDEETRPDRVAPEPQRGGRLQERGTCRVPARARPPFYFIELNARLQVEHPVSELVTGIDLVREQLRVAAGERSATTGARSGTATRSSPHQRRGSGARFRPCRGRSSASGRRSAQVSASTRTSRRAVIPPNYDSLLAKVSCGTSSSRDRPLVACARRARGRGRPDDGGRSA